MPRNKISSKIGPKIPVKISMIGDLESNGYIDNMTQLKTLEKCKGELDKAISAQEEKIENKSKVVMSMGLIGGLFLTIVLL